MRDGFRCPGGRGAAVTAAAAGGGARTKPQGARQAGWPGAARAPVRLANGLNVLSRLDPHRQPCGERADGRPQLHPVRGPELAELTRPLTAPAWVIRLGGERSPPGTRFARPRFGRALGRSFGFRQRCLIRRAGRVTIMGVLDGRVAVIAGGTSGIGARTAELFASEGARVVIAGRRAAQGKAQAAKLGPKTEFVRADVSAEADMAALVTGAAERHGRLDCLVNCAGEGGSPGGIAALDLGRLQRTLTIHLGGVAAGMKYAAPVMIAQRSGSIVNVASIGGHIAGWTFLDYSAAKAAIIQLTRCVAAELGQHGVRVNSISPGPILTGIFGKGAGLEPVQADQDAARLEPVFTARLEAYQPIRRAGVPADVAAAVLWLASDASSFVTGQDLAIDGGILAGRPPAASAADFTAIAQALLPAASPP